MSDVLPKQKPQQKVTVTIENLDTHKAIEYTFYRVEDAVIDTRPVYEEQRVGDMRFTKPDVLLGMDVTLRFHALPDQKHEQDIICLVLDKEQP